VVAYVNNSLSSTIAENLYFAKMSFKYTFKDITSFSITNVVWVGVFTFLFLIMGDFNFPLINWSSLQRSDKSSEQFLVIIQDGYLTQHVLESTCGGYRSIVRRVNCPKGQ